jgi:hypothetical protein
MMKKRETLDALIARSRSWWKNASPEEREAMHKAQAESWARSMAPCEHGVRDWETCPQCRVAVEEPTDA